MSTTARLEELKRDLARLEQKSTGPSWDGGSALRGRGREAGHPGEIPSRGWMDVLWRTWGEVGESSQAA
jgi:membrane protein